MFIIDAVLHSTSRALWTSHQTVPNIQYPINSFDKENGIITKPSNMSAIAKDAINQFCTVVKLFSVAMAMITNMLPTTITIIMDVIMIDSMMISARE